jgi:hypothetical protein
VGKFRLCREVIGQTEQGRRIIGEFYGLPELRQGGQPACQEEYVWRRGSFFQLSQGAAFTAHLQARLALEHEA